MDRGLLVDRVWGGGDLDRRMATVRLDTSKNEFDTNTVYTTAIQKFPNPKLSILETFVGSLYPRNYEFECSGYAFLERIRMNAEIFLKIHGMEIVGILIGNRMDLSSSILIVYFHTIDIVSK